MHCSQFLLWVTLKKTCSISQILQETQLPKPCICQVRCLCWNTSMELPIANIRGGHLWTRFLPQKGWVLWITVWKAVKTSFFLLFSGWVYRFGCLNTKDIVPSWELLIKVDIFFQTIIKFSLTQRELVILISSMQCCVHLQLAGLCKSHF